MILRTNGKIKANGHTIGMFLAYVYILTLYIAQDVLMSSTINSLCLYAFLAYSAILFVLEFKSNGKMSVFSLWYLIFMVVSFICMLYAPNIQNVFGSFYAMIVSLFVFLFLQMYVKDESGFDGICWCYAISAFVLVLLLLITGNLSGDADDRLGQSLTGNANIFAMMMMVAVMYTIWLLVFKAKRLITRTVLIVMIAVDFYALMLSAGRKFFVVPFIFLYILLISKRNKRGKKRIFLYTLGFAILILIVWVLIVNIEPLYNAIGVRMEGFFDWLWGGTGDASSEIRDRMRILAVERWLESPLWGYGFDSFKFYAKDAVGKFYYSHCNYTELLYCGGVVYFLLYYWMHFITIRSAVKNKAAPQSHRAFAIAVIISLAIFDFGAVTYNSTPMLIMLMMAFRAATFNTQKVNGESSYGKNKNACAPLDK